MNLTEALKIAKKYNFTAFKKKKLNEDEQVKRFINKPSLFSEINKAAQTSKFIEEMLLSMYGRQEDDERKYRFTKYKNFRGFNQSDAGLMSYIAEQYIEHHKLTPEQYRVVSFTLRKYHSQIFDILKEQGIITQQGRFYYFDSRVYTEAQIEQKSDEIALNMLDEVPEFNEEDFAHFAIEHAEEEINISGEDLKRARAIAFELYPTGCSVQEAGRKIVDELSSEN